MFSLSKSLKKLAQNLQRKYFIVFLGLGAAGKSTFIQTELAKYFPDIQFITLNSDLHLKTKQQDLAKEHFNHFKLLIKKKQFKMLEHELQSLIYQHASKGTIHFPLTTEEIISLVKTNNFTKFKELTFKKFYASYFGHFDHLRNHAKDLWQKEIEQKIEQAKDNIIIDSTGVASILHSYLKDAKNAGYSTALIFLDIDPQLAIERDKIRGQTEGREIGEQAVLQHVENIRRKYFESNFYQKDFIEGNLDIIFHFIWNPLTKKWQLLEKKEKN